MLRITIKDNCTKTISLLPQRLRDALIKAMQDSAVLIQSYAKYYAPVFRGMLRVSIAQRIETEGDKIKAEIGSGVIYADVIEEGRNPWQGAMPPPSGDLKEWARRKLGNERLSFVIARAIKKRGFKPQPYLRKALDTSSTRLHLIFMNRIFDVLRGL